MTDRPHYRTGVRSRRFSTDFSWFKRNLVADKDDPYTKTRPLGRTFLEYMGFLTGREHWDHASITDPLPVLKEIGWTLGKNLRDLVDRASGLLLRKTAPFQSKGLLRSLLKNPELGTRPMRLLVVCYGNICRSPFVERLLRQSLDPGRFEVRSCGFIERAGRRSPEDYALKVLEAGIDLSSHRSSVITHETVSWADLILLMDHHNWTMLGNFDVMARKKTLWLGAWSDHGIGEISDPYGKEPEEMQAIIDTMVKASDSLAKELASISSSLPPGLQKRGGVPRKSLSPGGR